MYKDVLDAMISCHFHIVCEEVRLGCSLSSTKRHSGGTLDYSSQNKLVSDDEFRKG
jgi:hypothetical protein